MGDVIDITKYLNTCDNCIFHIDGKEGCHAPGGWEWDKKYTRCITFRRRPEKGEVK